MLKLQSEFFECKNCIWNFWTSHRVFNILYYNSMAQQNARNATHNFFYFHELSGHIGEIVCWCPLLRPPVGNPGSTNIWHEYSTTDFQIYANRQFTKLPGTIKLIVEYFLCITGDTFMLHCNLFIKYWTTKHHGLTSSALFVSDLRTV